MLRINLLTKYKFFDNLIGDKRLNDADRRCIWVISDCYNWKRGKAWPPHSDIAKRAGLNRRTVIRSVSRLERLGIIRVITGGRGRANEYVPTYAMPATCDSAVTPPVTQLSHTPCDTAVSPHTTYPRSVSVVGSSGIPTASAGPPDGGPPRGGAPFEEFWRAYPKREGRARAKEKFGEVLASGVAVEILVAGAQRYAAAKTDVDPKWVKLPANWLAGECWLEDPQPLQRPRTVKEKSSRAAAAHKAKTADVIKLKPKPKPKLKPPPVMSIYEHAKTAVCADKPSKPEPEKLAVPDFVQVGATVAAELTTGDFEPGRVVEINPKGGIACIEWDAGNGPHWRRFIQLRPSWPAEHAASKAKPPCGISEHVLDRAMKALEAEGLKP